MKIETKFSLGDEVWFMRYNKIKSGHICELSVKYFSPNWYSESYKIKELSSNMNSPSFNAQDLFATKQELMESL